MFLLRKKYEILNFLVNGKLHSTILKVHSALKTVDFTNQIKGLPTIFYYA